MQQNTLKTPSNVL